MTITIDGTNITFVDGSTFNGANTASQLVPDTNSSNTASVYNVGYLALANTIFVPNGGGFYYAGIIVWGLNQPSYASSLYPGPTSQGPAINTTAPVNDYLGSQDFYVLGGPICAGTWRGRGNAVNTGLYQYYGNFVLLERVA
jgi:hypothetical protein